VRSQGAVVEDVYAAGGPTMSARRVPGICARSLTGWAMGFMAMLGLLALGGFFINKTIVLIDFIERASADGMPLRDAVVRAGRLRIRPIVLTSLTTIGGLLPLSLFGGALWAPMANGMIFGLAVPTVYVLFVEKFNMRVAA